MSNFKAFDIEHLKRLLEPFAPGIAQWITPIKYEAITPDSFFLLFRTTDKDNNNHFFVSYETDHIDNVEGARCAIEDWHQANIIDFWPRSTQKKTVSTDDLADYKAVTAGPYVALLAEVEPPKQKGYWAEAVVIMPGDHIGDKIAQFAEHEQKAIRTTLASILKHKTDATTSFLESYKARHIDTLVDDINQTDIAVSLYVQQDGRVEYFYNYVHQTVGGKTRKEN